MSFTSLSSARSGALELSFSKDEVFSTLSPLCGDKAPSPNGFSITFFAILLRLYEGGGVRVF